MDPALLARLERFVRDMDPYGDAPCRRTAAGDDDPSPPPSPNLGDDMRWCTCDQCVPSTNAEENVCCRAIAEVVAKGNDDCITRHIDFSSVCLNTAVLEAAYYAFDELGERMEGEIHKKYRFVSYRLFTKWIWRRLGRRNRVVLPACVVARIRDAFPSASYVGFRHPPLED